MFAPFKLMQCVIFLQGSSCLCLLYMFFLLVFRFMICLPFATFLLHHRAWQYDWWRYYTLFAIQLAMGVKQFCKSQKCIPQHLHQGFVDTYVHFGSCVWPSLILFLLNTGTIWRKKNRRNSQKASSNWSTRCLTQPTCGLWFLCYVVSISQCWQNQCFSAKWRFWQTPANCAWMYADVISMRISVHLNLILYTNVCCGNVQMSKSSQHF